MPREGKKDVLLGTLDLLILRVVSAGPIHGYGIARRIQQISEDVLNVQQGSLYPALHRLESKGLLSSHWATVGGRRRRVYELTPAGDEMLAQERVEWGSFARAVESVLESV